MNKFKNAGRVALCLMAMAVFSQTTLAQSKTSTDAFEISNEDLKEYLGQYDPEGGQFFSITVSQSGDDKLMAQPTDKSQPLTLMAATAKDKFDLARTPIKFTFNRGDDGKIISLTFAQGGNAFTAIKKKE